LYQCPGQNGAFFWGTNEELACGSFVVVTFFASVGETAAVKLPLTASCCHQSDGRFHPPAGRFRLVLATADKWKTPRGLAELYRVGAAGTVINLETRPAALSWAAPGAGFGQGRSAPGWMIGSTWSPDMRSPSFDPEKFTLW